jgi:hypothetical protein
MNISSFDDLLRAAREQPEPQRLLFARCWRAVCEWQRMRLLFKS